MVMTRNQKKNQINIPPSNSSKNPTKHSYRTRSNSNVNDECISTNPEETSNQVDNLFSKNDKTLYDKKDKNDKKDEINSNENLDEISPLKNNKKSNKNTVNKKFVKPSMTNLNGKSSMMQFSMPVSMMFFNVSKKSKNNNKHNKNNKDEYDEDECGINCDGCELCDDNYESNIDNGHDLDCDCDECEEDYDEDDYDEDEDEDDEDEMDEFFDYMDKIKILKNKIPNMKISDELKDKFTQILKSSNLDDKRLEWFDTLTKIPFGEFSKYNVDINDIELTKEYIKNVFNNLDNSVWGMHEVKEEILNYVAQCITQPESKPRVLALCGQPGIGKTKIVRDGISKSLDRPMRCFSMGGIKDSSTFFGFDYTYVGSKYGSIVQALIDCKTMNPVLFFDELDKISDTKEGQDIENFLIHLTDPVQNYDFNDKYFNGIPIDISKSLLIFSFNEMENISPILRDRLHIINIPNPSVKDKINIASKFFLKEFKNNFKLNEEEVVFDNDVLKHIIERYTGEESGVRKLRRCIETICMKINTSKLLGECVKELKLSTSKINITLPIKLTKEHIDTLLYVKDHKNDKIPFMYT